MDPILDNIAGLAASPAAVEFDATDLDGRTFQEMVANHTPCVVRNAVAHWPAFHKWHDKAYLQARCGKYRVSYSPGGNYLSAKRGQPRREISFSEALDILHSDQTSVGSLGGVELGSNGEFAELMDDIAGFGFLPRPPRPLVYPAQRFFVHRNAGTSWHDHLLDETLMCQVVGSKRIGLLREERLHDEHVRPILFGESYYDGAVSFDCVHPLRWLNATLNPGDALYIPPSWYHGVAPVDRSFGITAAMCWRSPLALAAHPNLPTSDRVRKMLGREGALGWRTRRGFRLRMSLLIASVARLDPSSTARSRLESYGLSAGPRIS
jgi:Cupin-like domain